MTVERDWELGRRSRGSALSVRVVWWLAFGVFAVWSTLWAFTLPPTFPVDEAAHAVKAAAVVRGDLQTSVREVPHFGGAMLFPQTYVHVPRAYGELGGLTGCWSFYLTRAATCAPDLPASAGPDTVVPTYVGTYPPVYYALVGWPSLALGPRAAIYAMRILSGLLCAALLASALESARRIGSGRLVVVGAALGITPAVLDIVGSINPNAVEIAAACALWSTLLLLVSTGRGDKKLVLRAAVAALLLTTVRPLGPLWLVGIVAFVLLATGGHRQIASFGRERHVRIAAVSVAVAALATIAFTLANHTLDSVITVPGETHDAILERAGRALEATGANVRDLVWLRESLWDRSLGATRWLFTGWAAVTVAGACVVMATGRARQRIVVGALLATCVALPIFAEVTNPGVSWQARYGLPIAVGLSLLTGWALDATAWNGSRRRTHFFAVAGGVLVVAMAVTHFVAHQLVTTRVELGLPHGLFDAVFGNHSTEPIAPFVLFVWAIVASVALAILIYVVADMPRDPSRERLENRAPTASAEA